MKRDGDGYTRAGQAGRWVHENKSAANPRPIIPLAATAIRKTQPNPNLIISPGTCGARPSGACPHSIRGAPRARRPQRLRRSRLVRPVLSALAADVPPRLTPAPRRHPTPIDTDQFARSSPRAPPCDTPWPRPPQLPRARRAPPRGQSPRARPRPPRAPSSGSGCLRSRRYQASASRRRDRPAPPPSVSVTVTRHDGICDVLEWHL